MSKKHFEAIAAKIASRLAATPDTGKMAVVALAGDLADVFAADNPRFDRARFLAACGV